MRKAYAVWRILKLQFAEAGLFFILFFPQGIYYLLYYYQRNAYIKRCVCVYIYIYIYTLNLKKEQKNILEMQF